MSLAGLHCPKCGCVSTDPGFCSDCGAAMTGPTPGAEGVNAPPALFVSAPAQTAEDAVDAMPTPQAGGSEICPACGEPRPGPFARYCDTCRYDFLARQPFSPVTKPASVQPSVLATVLPAEPAPRVDNVPGPRTGNRWDLRTTVDLTLRQPDDPTPPDERPRIFPLDQSDHLIGRRSDSEDIHPEIVVHDPGISRRHLRILRSADGVLSALDLGSMNGTKLNGMRLDANVLTPLNDGDELTLGCWTRLKVEAR